MPCQAEFEPILENADRKVKDFVATLTKYRAEASEIDNERLEKVGSPAPQASANNPACSGPRKWLKATPAAMVICTTGRVVKEKNYARRIGQHD